MSKHEFQSGSAKQKVVRNTPVPGARSKVSVLPNLEAFAGIDFGLGFSLLTWAITHTA